jgi:uncharacterized protein (TIGR02118 family)
MYRLTVIYGHPLDPAAFDRHYENEHAELVRRIPGLRRFAAGKCESLDGTEPASYSVAELYFDSKESLAQALGSPEGQAAAGDVANFATGGATMLFSDESTVGP